MTEAVAPLTMVAAPTSQASRVEPMNHPTTARSDTPFYVILAVIGGSYLLLIVAMLAADLFFTTPPHLWRALANPDIRYAIRLSLISCSITAILSVWVGVPLGY